MWDKLLVWGSMAFVVSMVVALFVGAFIHTGSGVGSYEADDSDEWEDVT